MDLFVSRVGGILVTSEAGVLLRRIIAAPKRAANRTPTEAMTIPMGWGAGSTLISISKVDVSVQSFTMSLMFLLPSFTKLV